LPGQRLAQQGDVILREGLEDAVHRQRRADGFDAVQLDGCLAIQPAPLGAVVAQTGVEAFLQSSLAARHTGRFDVAILESPYPRR
jgi:hypothetical protein